MVRALSPPKSFYTLTINTMEQNCIQCWKKIFWKEWRKFCSHKCYREHKTKNLVWKRIWNLKVIKKLDGWIRECKCGCWNHIERKWEYLRKWWNQSCWCLAKWWIRLSWTKFYHKYVSMKARCEDPKSDSYYLYWARWIKCLWEKFEDFYKDMYCSYWFHREMYWDEDTTLDRIDSDWNYCKENCRRATRKEQANNKSNNRKLTYRWKTDTLENRAKKLWLTYSALYQRLYKWMPFEFIVKHPEVKKISQCNEMLGKLV